MCLQPAEDVADRLLDLLQRDVPAPAPALPTLQALLQTGAVSGDATNNWCLLSATCESLHMCCVARMAAGALQQQLITKLQHMRQVRTNADGRVHAQRSM